MKMRIQNSVFRTLINVFNLIMFICGAVVLGLGVWSIVADNGLYDLLGSIMLIGVYILIASGAIVMLISFLGCYGSTTDSKPSIVVYSTVAIIAAVLQTIGCIILYVYYIESTSLLSDAYKTQYGVVGEDKINQAWDKAQVEGECCGLLSYRDWEDSQFYNETGKYPPSCCIPDPDNVGKALDETRCQRPEAEYIFEEGCEYVLKRYYYALGCTTIVIIILELAAVILIVAYYQRIP